MFFFSILGAALDGGVLFSFILEFIVRYQLSNRILSLCLYCILLDIDLFICKFIRITSNVSINDSSQCSDILVPFRNYTFNMNHIKTSQFYASGRLAQWQGAWLRIKRLQVRPLRRSIFCPTFVVSIVWSHEISIEANFSSSFGPVRPETHKRTQRNWLASRLANSGETSTGLWMFHRR